MNAVVRNRLLAALGAAGAIAAGMIALAPSGCASDCGSHCPVATVIIESPINVDPGILELGWYGPACPYAGVSCRGDDVNTFCRRISVTASAQGYCDVFIALYARPPMAVHLEFGPPSGQGCCKGFPVVGDSHFTIPLDFDAGIYGGDGNMDAVRIVTDDDASVDATDDTGTD